MAARRPALGNAPPQQDERGLLVGARFQQFIETFSTEHVGEDSTSGGVSTREPVKEYLDQLGVMKDNDLNTLTVNFQHVLHDSQDLAEAIVSEYYRFEPFLRRAVQSSMKKFHKEYASERRIDKEFFVSFYNLPALLKVRDLRSERIGRLVAITGTVTRTSEVRPELLYGAFRCQECGQTEDNVEQQFKYTEPTRCLNERCNNTNKWTLLTEQSKFVDWQRVRLQENSDEIPPGSMPRSVDVIMRHAAVERAKAGDKVTVVGSLIVVPDVAQLYKQGEAPKVHRKAANMSLPGSGEGISGLKSLGVRELTYRLAFVASSVVTVGSRTGVEETGAETLQEIAKTFTDAQRHMIDEMRRDPHVFDNMVKSIAPTVFGHESIKKGILLMLFGGVHKRTEEGIRLRGDINVCIVGDPSTAKSQFLKYVCQFLPRAVYTSGKASSSAGLTASVVRDPDTGEFCIEAGALMLADNGVCCIDEFDKMDPADQVAIHEAMEQQTISITKAGIQATLNARTSILAAANPVFGRYDKSKTLRQNVAMSPPIMSRFDLFFVVVDECNPVTDFQIAQHIVSVHQRREAALRPPFAMEQLQTYLKFARALNPVMTPDAQRMIAGCYLRLRSNDLVGAGQSYRITVRQLESLIRLSEAMARLQLEEDVQPYHVLEAFKLLRTSVIPVERGDIDIPEKYGDDDEEGAAAAHGDDAPSPTQTPTKQVQKQGGGAAGAPAAIPFKLYQTIAKQLAIWIRNNEEDNGRVVGVKQSKVVAWYLEQQELASEAALVAERQMVNQIINRLIYRDNVILNFSADKSTGPDEDRLLIVHPNFVL